MACSRCDLINETVEIALSTDHSPSYSQLRQLLQDIKSFTSSNYTNVSKLSTNHEFFAYNDTILAAVYIVYFKNKARDFYSVAVSFFAAENPSNRITPVDPFIGILPGAPWGS